jgi:hypothetical protein
VAGGVCMPSIVLLNYLLGAGVDTYCRCIHLVPMYPLGADVEPTMIKALRLNRAKNRSCTCNLR